MWKYYSNRDPETAWVVPWRPGDIYPMTPQVVAESDFGVKLGLLSLKRFEAWLVYRHREHSLLYIVDSVYTEFWIKDSPPISIFSKHSRLFVTDMFAKSPLEDSEIELFLEVASNSDVLNALFDASSFKLHRPIGTIVPASSTRDALKANLWR